MPDKPECCAQCRWWTPGYTDIDIGRGWCGREGVGTWKARVKGPHKVCHDDCITDANAVCRLFERKPLRVIR